MTTKVTTPVGVAAAASAAAGLIHAAAAGSHASDRTVALLFAGTAAAQLGLAAAAVVVPRRLVVTAGALFNAAVIAAWTASRLSGIAAVDGLADRQAVGVQDAIATAMAGVAVAAGLVALIAPRLPSLRTGWALALGSVALLGSIPAMTTPHEHSDSHANAASHADDRTVELAAGPDIGDDHLDGIDLPRVPGVTKLQETRAAQLIADTRKSLQRYPDVAAAEAAGFTSIGDATTGFEHFVHREYLVNADVLDPSQPESLVFKVEPDGAKTLASAMYILPPGKTMADVPDVAGALTTWHDHQNLCWDGSGTRLAGILVAGVCRPGGTFRPTPPMLHVWVTEHRCGPFAGIEGSAHTGACPSH